MNVEAQPDDHSTATTRAVGNVTVGSGRSQPSPRAKSFRLAAERLNIDDDEGTTHPHPCPQSIRWAMMTKRASSRPGRRSCQR